MNYSNAIDIYKEAIRILSTNLQIKSAYSKDIEIFNDRIKGANHNIYRIGVIGVTSSGKSTMINSFLGENILPSRIKPSSCQLVICHKGSKRSATIYHNNRPAEKIYGKNLTYDVLSKYADETYNSKNKENVKEIEITSPSFPFNDDIILIDSPGLDAFGFEGHEKLTMSTLLPTIDLCLLVTTCKSNSDEKTKDMLDAIASTHTATVPVIIVQNMMDSIQQSPDGTKSRNDVALDHRRRIERIIEKSGLPNKSAVKIVQYSAKNAVEGRINNEKGKIAESNYEKLTQTINDTINQLRPHIEGFRLKSAKKEIEEIAEQAKQHGGNTADSIVNQEFRHKDVKTKFENKTNKTKADISNILSQINNANNYIDSIETNNYNHTNLEKEFENHINIVKNIVKDCENKLIDVINYTTEFIANIGESVNIARRDLNFDIQVSSIQVPSVQKTKEKRREKKSGIINWVRRWWPFSDDDAGYEVYFVDVVDKKQTKKNLSQYVKNNTLVFKGCVDKLNQKIDAARIKIFTEVDK
ncbi:MAG: dynamin family protein, partial [Bacteroidales bacterium]|nr:dynamin family protein [Bacteroidales bacterium]